VYRNFDFGDGSSRITLGDDALSLRRISHRYDEPGVYQISVELMNSEGCMDVASAQLVVHEGLTLYAPNAFTPTNDGFNDGFRVEGSGVESFHMTISNRWGDTVFETEDMERYWNGSPRGDGLSHINDLFVYMIEATGICEDFKRLYGTVMLIR
jgi:gliding motility-associated-like protein